MIITFKFFVHLLWIALMYSTLFPFLIFLKCFINKVDEDEQE